MNQFGCRRERDSKLTQRHYALVDISMPNGLANQVDSIRVSDGSRAMSRNQLESSDEVRRNRDAMINRLKQIDNRLWAIGARIRAAGRLPSDEYKSLCDEQVALRNEQAETIAALKQVKSTLHELEQDKMNFKKQQDAEVIDRLKRIEVAVGKLAAKVDEILAGAPV